jgi:multidrug efflux pump subunit AcrB
MVASTLTGALGALPMVLNPGPASVMYRGLAAVNVAGVIFSMVFSVVLLPALLRLMYRERDVARAPAQLGAVETAGSLLASPPSPSSLPSPVQQ